MPRRQGSRRSFGDLDGLLCGSVAYRAPIPPQPADRGVRVVRPEGLETGLLDAVSILHRRRVLGAGSNSPLPAISGSAWPVRRLPSAFGTIHLPRRLIRIGRLAGRRGMDLLASGRVISGRRPNAWALSCACSERGRIGSAPGRPDRSALIKPERRRRLEGLAEERRTFSVTPAHHSPTNRHRGRSATTPRAPGQLDCWETTLQSKVCRRRCSSVPRSWSAAIAPLFAEIQERGPGFVTPLEAEQVRMQSGHPTLDGFSGGAGIRGRSHNPFRLAAAVRPSGGVHRPPSGTDPRWRSRHWRCHSPFSPARPPQLLRRGSCCSLPRLTTDAETRPSCRG